MAITVAFYDDMGAAQQAAAALIDTGFDPGDISVVALGRQGIVSGAPLSSGGVPPQAFAGIKALVETGIPQQEAESYAQGIFYGGVLVTVRSNSSRGRVARQILGQFGPVDIHDRAFAWRDAGWTGYHEPANASSPTAYGITPEDAVSEGFLAYQQEFNDHWEQNYLATGRPWDEYRRAYQFGYDAAYDSRFRRQPWEGIAGQLAEEWARRYPGAPWAEMGDAVHYAWQRICCNTQDLLEPQEG
jgi:hypothetical protein